MVCRVNTTQLTLLGVLVAVATGSGCPTSSEHPTADVAPIDIEGEPDVDLRPVENTEGVDLGPGDDAEGQDGEVMGDTPPLPPPELPATLGGGFTDLTVLIEETPPFPVADDHVPSDQRAEVSVGMFADLDGDGLDEVILSTTPRHGEWTNRAYRIESDGLTALPTSALPVGTTVLAEDLDGDGHIDLLSLSDPERPVFWGDGEGGWSEPAMIGGHSLHVTERVAIYMADLDQDGWLDLLASGYCEVLPFFRVELRGFVAQPHLLQGFPTPSAYAVMIVDLDALGPTLMALGNVTCEGPQEAIFGVTGDNSHGYPLFQPTTLHGPDPYWLTGQNNSAGFEALTYQAPMGAAAGDLDGDGLVDLVIPIDPIHAVFLGQPEGPMLDISGDTLIALLPDDRGDPMLGWGVAMLDLDRDGRPDLVVTHGDDGSRFETPPGTAPAMFTTAHINAGDLRFVDATELFGLGRRGRWRALAVGDPDRDGDPDLIVGGVGELPRIYRNDIETPHSGFSLRLRGTVSNHLGIGAIVEVEAQGVPTQYHYVGGVASPNVVSAPMVFIGLGEATGPVTTRVRWPSGLVQEVVDLSAGTMHVIEEPRVLTLNPVGRHVPADGTSRIEVVVTPQHAASEVVVALYLGLGTLEPAVDQGNGTWTAGVVAPTIPGSARLRIVIDGVPLRVRPRVWFDTSN